MLHHHFQRFVVLGAAVLFLAYAMATEDRETKEKADPDADSSDAKDEEASPGTVVDVASQSGRFGTWSLAVRQSGLVGELEGSGPFTLFAPTDDAFAELKERLDELLADDRRLAAILRRHIVPGRYASSDLSHGMELKTLAETTLAVTVTDTGVSVSDSTVIEPDLTAGNGVIHGVERVMLPQTGNADQNESE